MAARLGIRTFLLWGILEEVLVHCRQALLQTNADSDKSNLAFGKVADYMSNADRKHKSGLQTLLLSHAPSCTLANQRLCNGCRHRPALRMQSHDMLALGFSQLAKARHSYAAALVAAPVATNMITAAVLSMIADGIAQAITGGEARTWDRSRSAWIAVWGASVLGYILMQWFALLAYLYPDARHSVLQLVGKVATNQLVMAPMLNAGFFAFVIFTRVVPYLRMNSEKWSSVRAKWKKDLLPTLMRSTFYWSSVQTFNFRIVPQSLTTVCVNFFFVIWTVYLSIIGNRGMPRNDTDEKALR